MGWGILGTYERITNNCLHFYGVGDVFLMGRGMLF